MLPPTEAPPTLGRRRRQEHDGGRGVTRRRLAVRGLLVAAGAVLASQLVVVGTIPRVLGTSALESYVLPYCAAAASSPVLARETLVLVNRARGAARLAPLAHQDALDAIARAYARELFAA